MLLRYYFEQEIYYIVHALTIAHPICDTNGCEQSVHCSRRASFAKICGILEHFRPVLDSSDGSQYIPDGIIYVGIIVSTVQ